MTLVRRKSLRQKKHCKWVRSQEVILNKWHHIAQPRFTELLLPWWRGEWVYSVWVQNIHLCWLGLISRVGSVHVRELLEGSWCSLTTWEWAVQGRGLLNFQKVCSGGCATFCRVKWLSLCVCVHVCVCMGVNVCSVSVWRVSVCLIFSSLWLITESLYLFNSLYLFHPSPTFFPSGNDPLVFL